MRAIAVVLILAQAAPAFAQAPPAAPSPDTRTIRDVVTAVARYQLKPLEDGEYKRGTWEEVQANKLPKGLTWTYQYGVVLYGLLRAAEATGDKTFAAFVADHNRKASAYASYLRWVDRTYGASQKEGVDALLEASRFRRFIRMDRLDFCGAMAHSMLESVLKHGVVPDAAETEILDYVADYIQNKQGRIEGEGVFFRPEAKDTLWIDDLYMSCPFLIRRAKQKNDPALLDDAARQVKGMAKRQQDADGLWYHAAWVKENRRSPYKWGRANGWAMVTTVEVLSAMPESHPDRQALIDILRKHVAGVAEAPEAVGPLGAGPRPPRAVGRDVLLRDVRVLDRARRAARLAAEGGPGRRAQGLRGRDAQRHPRRPGAGGQRGHGHRRDARVLPRPQAPRERPPRTGARHVRGRGAHGDRRGSRCEAGHEEVIDELNGPGAAPSLHRGSPA